LSERLRHTYLSSILVQDAAFFDKIGSGEISIRASKDIETIRTAFGEKLGYLVWTLSTIITVSVQSSHCTIADIDALV
jgi:ATP-binding cassette subfamily B (MDR/TAP) protein 1